MTHDQAILHLTDFGAGRIDDPELRHTVARHVVDCLECQSVLEVAEGVEQLAALEAPPAMPLRPLWPAATAASLLLAAAGLWWGIGGRGTSVEQALVLSPAGTVRGPEAPPSDLLLRAGQRRAELVFAVPSGAPIVGARLELTGEEGRTVWSAEAGAIRPMEGTAWVRATVPTSALPPGLYTLTFRAADGTPLVTRRIRALRLP